MSFYHNILTQIAPSNQMLPTQPPSQPQRVESLNSGLLENPVKDPLAAVKDRFARNRKAAQLEKEIQKHDLVARLEKIHRDKTRAEKRKKVLHRLAWIAGLTGLGLAIVVPTAMYFKKHPEKQPEWARGLDEFMDELFDNPWFSELGEAAGELLAWMAW